MQALAVEPLKPAFHFGPHAQFLEIMQPGHEVPGEAFNQHRCGKILKSLFLERRAPSPVARLVSGSCGQADFRAEHEPVRRLALCNLWRPGEPPSPYDGSV